MRHKTTTAFSSPTTQLLPPSLVLHPHFLHHSSSFYFFFLLLRLFSQTLLMCPVCNFLVFVSLYSFVSSLVPPPPPPLIIFILPFLHLFPHLFLVHPPPTTSALKIPLFHPLPFTPPSATIILIYSSSSSFTLSSASYSTSPLDIFLLRLLLFFLLSRTPPLPLLLSRSPPTTLPLPTPRVVLVPAHSE